MISWASLRYYHADPRYRARGTISRPANDIAHTRDIVIAARYRTRVLISRGRAHDIVQPRYREPTHDIVGSHDIVPPPATTHIPAKCYGRRGARAPSAWRARTAERTYQRTRRRAKQQPWQFVHSHSFQITHHHQHGKTQPIFTYFQASCWRVCPCGRRVALHPCNLKAITVHVHAKEESTPSRRPVLYVPLALKKSAITALVESLD